MRMQILKVVVVLLVAGSGDARPQKSGDANSAPQAETSDVGWRDVQARNNATHDTIRDDSRYTGTSGRNRKSYIRGFRDSVDLSRGLAPTTRSSSYDVARRRSKIDDIWTTSEFKAPTSLSRTNVLGEIGVPSSNKANGSSSLRGPSGSGSGADRTIDYSKILGGGNYYNLGRPNRDFKSTVARTRYSSGNHFLANHHHASGLTSGDISIAKNRQGSGSIKSDSFSNKRVLGNDRSRWRIKQVSSIARTKVSIDPRESAISSTRSVHKEIGKNTDSIVTSKENPKLAFATDSLRLVVDAEHADLNNSTAPTHPIFISDPKSRIPYDATRRPGITSNRNFVRLRYPFSTLNRGSSSVALNSKPGDDVQSREPMKNHLTASFDHHSTKSHRHPSQKLSSPVERVEGTSNAYLKIWPNETSQNIEDLYKDEKYTLSLKENLNRESGFHDADQTPMILSSDDGYYNHPDPIIDASVKKIIHWLKVDTMLPNGSQLINEDVHKPVESVFDSIYENLEPNRPLSDYNDDRYETVVLQDPSQNQDLEEINHEEYPDPALQPQYSIDSTNLSPPLTSWPNAALLKNKTVLNPMTLVTQNTVVQILNDGSKEANVTKVPQLSTISGDEATSSENKEPSKQETNTFPSSYNCPTITINTYTRVNNTIQSKEGCTDLNIIVNSHVLNTNVFKPSNKPTELAQTSLATEGYDNESDKYSGELDDLSHQDSSDSFVTAAIGSYSPVEAPQPDDYYDSHKDPLILDPVPELSTVEVFQNTHISLTNSDVPLPDPAGSSVDGNPVGEIAEVSGSPDPAPVVHGLASSNAATGQAINGPGTLQLPALPNIPARPLASAVGGLASSVSAGSSGNKDDEDDEFDMSPSGVLQSVASVFTYFSLLNPLGYSFFSLAAAPFAAMAAGVLGVAAVIFPWAIPNVIDFGRATDKVTVRFRPNVEEFVKQAVHKYKGLNEWKSRRKKRRRCEQKNITHRELKDLQYMDQSLRTVATQLLNVTNPQEVIKTHNKEFTKVEHGTTTTLKSPEESDTSSSIRDVSSEIENSEPVGLTFGRPINSKFSYFESSHPGQAMAITEEELEREMSSTRLMNAYKHHPTTTGGISTWILLNPPSTTVKSAESEKTKLQQPFQTEVRLTVRPSSSIDKAEPISQSEKTVEKSTPQLISSVITTEKVITKKQTTATTTKRLTTTPRPERESTLDAETLESSSSTSTLKVVRTTPAGTWTSDETIPSSSVSTTKKNQRTTVRPPKSTTPRTTKPITPKPTRSGQQGRPKPTTTKRTTIKLETTTKNETTATTGKIEKVTFKPVQIITTPQNKPESTEKPIFVTKIKASMLMDNQKAPSTLAPTSASTSMTLDPDFASKTDLSGTDLVEVLVRSKPSIKGNTAQKAQLKKPAEEATQIEIEPIKVNAPILKIEKLDKNKMEQIVEKNADNLNNSKVDLQFEFNHELTRINVDTQTEVAATSTTSTTLTTTPATSSTTKRPRHNSKRKKNKGRRRKPSTTSTVPSSTTVATVISTLMETSEGVTDPTILDNAIQESKIAPDTKIAKNKKKQPQKAISTQIYNFLSREVMPSFGVMSLVGLGLGLASYFLYPFGGTIARRNYEVEPNYKYNPEEYGGNYGQSEEEVLSKVFQGMTNHENKYPGVNSNYYHYQHYDGAYDTSQTTKRTDARYPSIATSPVHRTVENTQAGVKYRNTDFRYAEAPTTPVYYERKQDLVAEASGSADRQFVVGNVPKEYPFEPVKAAALPIDSKNVNYVSTEIGQTQFERDIAQGLNFPPNSADLHNYGAHLTEVSTVRSDDGGYEEIEITPTAVAVEHGPRSLKVKRAVTSGDQRSRSKRESVIQVIPSKHELEEEREEAEKEEDLSNEILDIIDSALPGGDQRKTTSEENEVDFEGQRKKQKKESVTKTPTTVKSVEDTTKIPETSTPKTVEGTKEDLTTEKSSSDGETPPVSTTSNPKDTKATTVEWFDDSTTKKPAEGFSLFDFVKKVAEIKFRLGLTILKHASEGFARYLGHVQKRINGEE
ncbi:uncharacterized protein LOC114932054 [Nylanderia fulva]|uniref:uncharacterized protein LOC114932054 n=1 Tax=Nylanderia fulva TaxID=613905 RepID=UPI0010FB0C1B|nr:uncharacterized protein LOC114932054 [Nylanderia fulva]